MYNFHIVSILVIITIYWDLLYFSYYILLHILVLFIPVICLWVVIMVSILQMNKFWHWIFLLKTVNLTAKQCLLNYYATALHAYQHHCVLLWLLYLIMIFFFLLLKKFLFIYLFIYLLTLFAITVDDHDFLKTRIYQPISPWTFSTITFDVLT